MHVIGPKEGRMTHFDEKFGILDVFYPVGVLACIF